VEKKTQKKTKREKKWEADLGNAADSQKERRRGVVKNGNVCSTGGGKEEA